MGDTGAVGGCWSVATTAMVPVPPLCQRPNPGVPAPAPISTPPQRCCAGSQELLPGIWSSSPSPRQRIPLAGPSSPTRQVLTSLRAPQTPRASQPRPQPQLRILRWATIPQRRNIRLCCRRYLSERGKAGAGDEDPGGGSSFIEVSLRFPGNETAPCHWICPSDTQFPTARPPALSVYTSLTHC